MSAKPADEAQHFEIAFAPGPRQVRGVDVAAGHGAEEPMPKLRLQ